MTAETKEQLADPRNRDPTWSLRHRPHPSARNHSRDIAGATGLERPRPEHARENPHTRPEAFLEFGTGSGIIDGETDVHDAAWLIDTNA